MTATDLGRALYDALEELNSVGYLGEYDATGETSVDGWFNLSRVAQEFVRRAGLIEVDHASDD